MHRAPRSRSRSSRSAITPLAEVESFVAHEIPRCAIRASALTELVSSIGSRASTLLVEVRSEGSALQLSEHAHALQGVALHLGSALLELQAIAGKLEMLADAKRTLESAEPQHSDR